MTKNSIYLIVIILIIVLGYYIYRNKSYFMNFGFYDKAGLTSSCIQSGLKLSTCYGGYPYRNIKNPYYYRYPYNIV
jgi:hypothetical protein